MRTRSIGKRTHSTSKRTHSAKPRKGAHVVARRVPEQGNNELKKLLLSQIKNRRASVSKL